jgi:Tfp pilus assembly protein PilX
MTLWQKIKLGFGAAVGLLIGILGFTLDRRTKQRDHEREQRLKADHARAAESTRREDEKRINQAMAEQRDANEINAQKPTDRTGKFGTSDRLRKE